MEFEVGAFPPSVDTLELWSGGEDRLSIALQAPGCTATPFIVDDTLSPLSLGGGNAVRVVIDDDADDTGDRLMTIFLEGAVGGGSPLVAGTWQLHLRADQILDGRYDVWIERTARSATASQTRFTARSADTTRTISIPGTARRVITVGSYVTRLRQNGSSTVQDISGFSGRGPTRYNLLKPELTAPGEDIESTVPLLPPPVSVSPPDSVSTAAPVWRRPMSPGQPRWR